MDELTSAYQPSQWNSLPEQDSRATVSPWSSASSVDAFAAAIGIALPLQFQLHDSRKNEAEYRSIPLPYLRIGCHPAADVFLPDDVVKRCHAYLQPLAGHLFGMLFTGLETSREPDRLKRWFWMRPGQTLRVGETRFRLMREPATLRAPFATFDWNPFLPVAEPESLMPRLVLTSIGSDYLRQWHMDRSLALVGSSVDATLRLREDSVAGFACSLVHTQLGVWAVDLLGNPTTQINGEAIHAARLQEGDVLNIGDFSFSVHYEDPLPDTVSVSYPKSQATWTPQVAPTPPPSVPVPLPALGNNIAPTDLQGLMQQFGFLQQHLFEQFNQTMMLMFQMFNTLRQDQLQTVRQDLARVQQMLSETTALQTTAVALTKKPRSVDPAPLKALPSSAARPGTKKLGMSSDKGVPFSSSLPEVPEDSLAASQTRHTRLQAPTTMPPEFKSDQDIHAWLSDRLSSIRQESQGRWQNLLDYFRGKG